MNRYDVLGFIATFAGVAWNREISFSILGWQNWCSVTLIFLGIWFWCHGKCFTPRK